MKPITTRRAPRALRAAAPFAAVVAVTMLLVMASAPHAVHAGGVCDHCATINDTTSSGGDVATPKDESTIALAPPIAFIGADSVLRCAMPAGTGWQLETVDASPGAGGCAIALDAAWTPHIVYHDRNGVLWHAHRLAGGGWTREPIDPTAGVHGRVAVAHVPTGFAVAYVNAGILRYAELAVGGWSIENVAQSIGGEAYPSLATDGGVRAISWYDATAGDLKFALRMTGGGWLAMTVDAAGDVGRYSSLVGSPNGFGIAYYDFTHGDLRYALSPTGTGWTLETIDALGDVGRFCAAVAFAGTPDDQVGIAYRDQDRGDLKYAMRRGGTWTIARLDTAGDTGWDASAGGTPVPGDTLGVAYVERSTGSVLYLARANRTVSVPPPAPATTLHVTWSPARDGAGGNIRFNVPEPGRVEVAIYDVSGRRVAVPLAQDLPAGAAEARWPGLDARGRRVGSGVCFVRVVTPRHEGAARALVLE